MVNPIPPWADDPYDPANCPPTAWESWEWVQGTCTGNGMARSSCVGWDRPVVPPEWYPELLLGVLRMRLKWA